MIRESTERLRVNACRLQNLLEEVLSFAEIRAGRRLIRAEAFRLSDVVEELAPGIREQLAGKAATFSWRVAEGADQICTDRRKLQRVLTCLLSNSVKFTEAGWVTLSVETVANGQLEFIVADTGIGIPSSDLAIVFEQFRQLDGSFTRRYGGVGLGLTLARELTLLLGGEMDIDSHVGEGTTVRVRLPRSVKSRSGSETEVARPSRSGVPAGVHAAPADAVL